MTPDQKAEIAALFAQTGAYYGRAIDDAVLRMYVADVADLPAPKVVAALNALRREPKRRSCPLPAEVRHAVGQAGGLSPEEVAARIIGAMSSIGYTRPETARQKLGELAWEVVGDMGGWVQLCQSLTVDQVQSFRAQAREVARAKLQRGELAAMPTALPPGVAKAVAGRLLGARSPRP